MSNAPAKVFIQIETASEQQDHLKTSRKTLKVLQNAATDKENLAGRPLFGRSLSKSKIDCESTLTEPTKRKKFYTQGTQTEEIQNSDDCVLPEKLAIRAEDLTTTDNPGEHYWELLAEQRRKALEKALRENRDLYERNEGLEEELNTSRQMLDEARDLVEVLTEMLNENEEETGINKGASTSGSSSQLDLEKDNADSTDDE